VTLPESREVRVQRLYPRTVLKPGVRTMLVPVPRALPGAGHRGAAPAPRSGQLTAIGAPPLRDAELIGWCEELIEAVLAGLGPVASDA
jgi:transcription-repair coupling factor (superfamily II helicase)